MATREPEVIIRALIAMIKAIQALTRGRPHSEHELDQAREELEKLLQTRAHRE